jgi:NADH-quinone oxidoreductase subunit F
MAAGRDLKAVLVGGPSGAFLPPDRLATPYTFTDLRTAGAHVGSGAIVVADASTCLVDLARLLTRFSGDEACGKTIPCRIGLRRIAEIGQRIADGTTRPTDEQLLEDLAADCAASALCDHERLAPGPLLSLVRSFRSDVDDHVVRGVCAAGVCTPVRLAPAHPATEAPAPWPT